MRTVDITINGVTYPCCLTMGAMLRYSEVTGREVTEDCTSLRDMCVMIWACVASAAAREGKDFGYSFAQFCDNTTPDDIIAAWQGVQAQAVADTPRAEADGANEAKKK